MAELDPLLEMVVVVEHRFSAGPPQVFDFLTDLQNTAALNPEVVEAVWLDPPHQVGSRFRATNRRGDLDWTVTCHVLELRRPVTFAWSVSAPSAPASTWRYDLRPARGDPGFGNPGAPEFRHGPGSSMIRRMLGVEGADSAAIIARRAQTLRTDMAALLVAADRRLGSGEPDSC